MHLVEMEKVYLSIETMATFDSVCRAYVLKTLNMVTISDMRLMLFYFTIVEFILSNMASVLDMCVWFIRHLTNTQPHIFLLIAPKH